MRSDDPQATVRCADCGGFILLGISVPYYQYVPDDLIGAEEPYYLCAKCFP